MGAIKKIFYLALMLGVCWIILINIVKQMPKGSETRRIADSLLNNVAAVFGSKPIVDFSSPQQVENLNACFAALAANISKAAAPEQCGPMLQCIKFADEVLRMAKVAYQDYGIHRLSKVSLGWQMDLIYLAPVGGDGKGSVVEHLVCVADGEKVIKLSRPNE